MLSNSFNANKNKQVHAFYKMLKLPHKNFNYPYLVLIPKFYKKPVKFRTVTVGCNIYVECNTYRKCNTNREYSNASKFLLSILK